MSQSREKDMSRRVAEVDRRLRRAGDTEMTPHRLNEFTTGPTKRGPTDCVWTRPGNHAPGQHDPAQLAHPPCQHALRSNS